MWGMFEMVKLFFLEMKCSTNNSHSPDESNIVISGQLHAYACLCMSILHLSSMQRTKGSPFTVYFFMLAFWSCSPRAGDSDKGTLHYSFRRA